MSHGTCATLKVDDGNGCFYVINKTDFDPEKHEEYSADLAPEKPAAPNKGTAAWLKLELAAKGIGAPEGATKAELQALLDGAASD